MAIGSLIAVTASAADSDSTTGADTEPDAYRTPRAGEAVDRTVFGRPVRVDERDLRRIFALDLGFASTIPSTGDFPVTPFGALYLFWRPDEDRLVEAIVAGVRNDVLIAWSPESWGPFELIGTLDTTTIPAAQSEIVYGDALDAIEIIQGTVRGAFGIGMRTQVGDAVDNMFSAALLVEPGILYFDRGDDTASVFVLPQDTFELRGKFQLRYDGFERNLLSMIHAGFGFGAEALGGYRASWSSWGIGGAQGQDEGALYGLVRGYLQTGGPVPFVRSERHRLLGSLHFGVGFDVDRFSALRLGGGPEADQYRAVDVPLVPGAAIGEFYPTDYLVMLAEYRYELLFFSYLGVRGAVSRLGPNADDPPLPNISDNRWYYSIGGRWTTGFFFQTRMRIDYNYNFEVIRNGNPGSHEVVFDISREFF